MPASSPSEPPAARRSSCCSSSPPPSPGASVRPQAGTGRAAAAGDITRLKSLLSKTAPDTPEDGLGALAWASRAGQVDAVAVLLDTGADPNRRDQRHGWTPLMHALHKRPGAVARLLLSRGADPRIGAGGTGPVVMATLDNDAALVRTMLASKPPREQRQQALDEAVGGGALADIDRPLLGHLPDRDGARAPQDDPTLRVDQSGAIFSPLWWARRQGCDQTIALATTRQVAARR